MAADTEGLARPPMRTPLSNQKTPIPPKEWARWWGRRLSALARARPDFLIVGTQKGGTTSLYQYLARHPQVAPARTKEVHYFDVSYGRGAGWYQAQFPRRSAMGEREERLGKPVVTGESSPYYLFHPAVPQRVARDLPGVKLIVLLRDPVTRAFSHYHHEVRIGHEALSFKEAVRREPERLRGEHERLLAETGYFSEAHAHHSYLARGRYAEQLERWLPLFPPERVLVLKSEAFFDDPQGPFDAVARFLDIEPAPLGTAAARNAGSYDKATEIPDEAALRARFEEPNRRLYALLDRDFGW